MQIRSRFLLWVNGALVLLWGLYLVVDEVSERKWMLRREVQNLQSLAGQVNKLGFTAGVSSPDLPRVVSTLASEVRGTEIMVLDKDFRVVASSAVRRVGRPWREDDIARVLRGEVTSTWKIEDHKHDDVPMLDVSVATSGTSTGGVMAIHVARSLGAVEDKLREQRWSRVLWGLLSMLLMGSVITLVSHRWLLGPLRQVMETLSASRWFRSREHRGDELARLRATVRQMVTDADAAVVERDDLLRQVQSFNRQLEQRIEQVKAQLSEAQAELVDKERLLAVGELAAGLAHELRTPMHIVRGAAELLADEEANREACKDIFEEVDRVARFVDDLLLFARPVTADSAPVRVAPVIRSAADAVCRSGVCGQVEVDVDCPEELEISVGGIHLRQVVFNLVSNAVAASRAGGQVRVRATEEDGARAIVVQDDGKGIAADDQERLFSPFFTRRPGGTGLGLAIVRRLVDLYGGAVTLQSAPGQGATFTVRYPHPAKNERAAEEL